MSDNRFEVYCKENNVSEMFVNRKNYQVPLLTFLVEIGDLDKAVILIHAGNDQDYDAVNYQDEYGNTIGHFLAMLCKLLNMPHTKYDEYFNVLYLAGLDLDLKNVYGHTAMDILNDVTREDLTAVNILANMSNMRWSSGF